MKTTLKNSFHNTSITVRKSEADLAKIIETLWTGSGEKLKAAKRFAASCQKRLCGCAGCTCGDDLGRRE